MAAQGRFKRRVFVGAGLGVGAVTAWAFWSHLHTPVPVSQPPPTSQSFVRVAGTGADGADQVLRERAELFDPRPLFLPTEWNYGQRPLPANLRRQPGQVFGSFDPKWTFTDPALKSYGAETTPAPEKLSDVLVQGNEAPFAGFGQIDAPRPALPLRAGFLEIRGFKDNKPIISQQLAEIKVPRLDYAPLEFLVVVGRAGVVGAPVLISGSGWEEVDAFFRSYLVKTFRMGERLNPGRYRVLVGP